LVLLLAACSVIGTVQSGPATWTFDRDADIGPDTTQFAAWVTEINCASGESSAGRILGPDIHLPPESIVVTFTISRLGGVQSCQSNPPTAVTVSLPEPLGDRLLLDGGREPPAEPPICAGTCNSGAVARLGCGRSNRKPRERLAGMSR
jgi:hypothetical protein